MTQNNTWTVYFLRCNDNSLYTGITTDIKRRLHQHNNTKLGAKYTRARRPVKLVYSETAIDKSSASKREYQLRTLTKKQKEELVLAYPDSSIIN
ncbi:GIY-YIG nuclease family protein [Candidatus Colwellia aromaticivorans]|uniref:GIY-YIG nuclease family protein n=1 Tax=Candidatus Colwellia aromaticivorans TaxID=2267621 RepID=UPI000DF1B4F4|nr:GIY-YIG nuclease family protein [Candidatus Colwellia aromaticivorans]